MAAAALSEGDPLKPKTIITTSATTHLVPWSKVYHLVRCINPSCPKRGVFPEYELETKDMAGIVIVIKKCPVCHFPIKYLGTFGQFDD